MKKMDFNINRYVYVRLTSVGKEELKRQHEELKKMFPLLEDYTERKEDVEGFSEWQLYYLMSKLGHMFVMGRDVPFETNIKIEVTGNHKG